jgi:signal transduction histidine kinase
MDALGAEAAVPLRSGSRLRGLILLGRKKSGARLSLSDLAYLELVRSAAVLAIQKAELADEGRAKTEMVSVAAHELLTPIAGVQGYLSMVLDEGLGEVDERARGYLSKANASASRLSSLVKDLLSATRLEAGKTKIELRPTDVAAIARDAVDGIVPLAREKGLSLSFAPSSGLPSATADPDRLAEVLTNLVGNAVKYTPQGSVEVTARSEGAFVRIDVKDTGLGMSEEARARLFQKFYRVKTDATRDIPGTGLGLYVTRQLVERMGGRIAIESVEGAGSTFTVWLPIALGRGTHL